MTCKIDTATKASAELRRLLTAANVKELKWEKIRTAKERFATLHVADWLFANLSVIRADVLTWDTEDARHRVLRRDDVGNLHRMYHHLFKNVLRQRWPTGSTWRLYPDEQDSMDWEKVHEILDAVSMKSGFQPKLREDHTFTLSLKVDYRVMQIVPSRSHDEPLIQVADLLAGMAAFSRLHFELFREWEDCASGQTSFFHTETQTLSGGQKEKCAILSEFYRRCRHIGLPISLKSSCGLRTHDPKCAVNFWHYTPQRATDRAPLKHAG